MSKKKRQLREDLNLFSLAGIPEPALLHGDKLKLAPSAPKPNRKVQKKLTSPASVKEASNERYLRDSEVAHRYGVSRQTVWRWVAQGTLPEPIKLSVSVTRWRLSDLIAHEISLPKGAKGQVVRQSRVKTANAGGQQ